MRRLGEVEALERGNGMKMRYWKGMILAGLVLCVMPALAQTTVTTSGGTTNTIPLYTGSSTIGNSAITQSGGSIGIGTAAPGTTLQIGAINSGTDKISLPGWYNFENVYLGQYGNGDSALEFVNHTDLNDSYGVKLAANVDSGGAGLQIQVAPSAASYSALSYATAMMITTSSNVGIGTTFPGAKLEVNGNIKLTAGSGASLTFADGTVQSTAYTGVTCGGDYAESVDVSGNKTSYEPGDVLVISGADGSDVEKSSTPYSTMVAGIYSTKPGYVGRRQRTKSRAQEVPMAMVGIVPTKVSAENGPIRRGDLLVTSSTVGYAMKGTDRSRMLGAVVGKAMGNLESGKGVIEVLVTLQ
jgi:hypothetical protein